ncbi:MAG: helix-turn-helix domain-containing protein [Candidatus Margulisiibacteriota bacterium]
MARQEIQHHLNPSWLHTAPVFDIHFFDDSNPYVQHPRPHTVKFYEIIWILEGTGVRVIDFEDHPLRHNRLFFMYPGAVHFWRKPVGVKGIFISFSEEFLLKAWPSSDFSPLAFFSIFDALPYLDLDTPAPFQALLKEMELEFKNDEPDRLDLLAGYLRIMLLKLSRLCREVRPEKPNEDIVVQFKKLLAFYFKTHQQVSDYAKLMFVSPQHLNQVVKEKTGRTVGDWIRSRLILEAKRELAHTDKPLSSIAVALQFEDADQFCRYFKRNTGQSPTTFRKMVKG